MRELLKKDIRGHWRAAAFMLTTAVVLVKCFGAACISRLITGLPCPACGMTRAALLFLSGRFLESFRLQPFFYALTAGIIFFGINRYLLKREKCGGFLKCYAAVMVLAAFIFYVFRMVRDFPDVPPMIYSEENLLSGIGYLFFNRRF